MYTFYGSSITDWIQAIVSFIAVPGAIAGFWSLFVKDKDKQEQINKLSGIAEQLDVQNSILTESNKLLSEQIDLFRNSTILSKNDEEGTKKLLDIEERKLKLSVQPFFRSIGGGSNGASFEIKITNLGARAKIIQINAITDNIYAKGPLPIIVDKNQTYRIDGITIDGRTANSIVHKIEIIYEDALKNRYRQLIDGIGGSGKLLDPEEIKNEKSND